MSRADLHIHTRHSLRSPEWLLRRLEVPASVSDPKELRAKLRRAGMDFVTFTDDDTIDGCLEIAGQPGTFLSESVTTTFPEDGVRVSLLVWGITELQHREIQQLRPNIYELQQYLAQAGIAHGVAMPLQGLADKLRPGHLMRLALLFRHFEGINGRSIGLLSTVTRHLFDLTPADIERFSSMTGLRPTHADPWKKVWFGGSDDHGGTIPAGAFTETPSASDVPDFLAHLREGRCEARGSSGTPLRAALDTYQVAFSHAKERLAGHSASPTIQLVEKAFARFMEGKDPTVFTAGEKFAFLAQGIASGKIFELANPGPRSLWKELSGALNEPVMRAELTQELEGVEDSSRRAFLMANMMASRLAYRLTMQFLQQLMEGRFLESIQMVGPVVPLVALLSPYLYAFRTPPRERLREASILLRGDLPPELLNTKRAWFTDTLDDVNGVSTTIQRMSAALAGNGKAVEVMVSRKEVSVPGIPLKNFPPIGEFELPEYELQKLSFPPLLQIIDHLQSGGFTEVIISTPGPVGLAALAAAKVLGLPTTVIYHTDFPEYVRILTEDGLMESLTWNYMHWFHSQFDTIYVNSDHYRQCWVGRGLPAEKLKILPRGLDTGLFHPEKKQNDFWKQRGLRDGEVGALYVGRVSREKNLDLLAASCRRLLASGVKVRPLVVGDGPYAAMMKELLPEGIYTGSLHREELAAAYASADFFVFPSTTDTFGNVVIEAQASGIPVIVSDVGGPKDLIEDGVDGLITKGLDLDALTAAITKLCDDAPLRKKMGEASRARVAERDWNRAARLFWEGSEE
jgi:glycosyltransferase involved in cell wall biosynthesis